MIYGFYRLAWVIWLAAIVIFAAVGGFSPALAVALGLVALALVHGAAWYLVVRDTHAPTT